MEDKKLERLQLRITFEDKDKLKYIAKKTGRSLSTIIKMILDGYQLKEKPDDKFYEKIDRLRNSVSKLDDLIRYTYKYHYNLSTRNEEIIDSIRELISDIRRTYLIADKANNDILSEKLK